MSSVFFYTGIVAFTLGIFVRSFVHIGLVEVTWALLLAFVVALIWRRKSKAFSAPYLLTLSIFLLCFSLGALRMEVSSWNEIHKNYETQLGEKISIEGVVVREPEVKERSTSFVLQVEEELLLISTDAFADISYGDRLIVEGKLSKPEAFETDLGRTFNYPGYLLARGISYVIPFATLTKVSGEEANPVLAMLLSFKHRFMDVIELHIREPQSGLSQGLLLGVKRALGEDLESAFRKTGIIHIVVLSGYNVMLVVTFIMYVFSFFLPLRMRLIFGLVAISAFALIVGLSATVVRASLMAALLLVARFTGRTYAVTRALMLAGSVMLLLNPYLLVYDTGFQLSFIATLGLILVAPHLEKYVHFMPSTLGLREFLTATLATQIFVMPILLYQIGEFSVVAVVVNMLVLPMVPVAMLLTFATGIVGLFSTFLAVPFAFLAHVSLTYILVIAEYFAALPFASYIVPAFPFFVVPILYALLGYVLWRAYRKEHPLAATHGWVIEDERKVAGEQSSPATEPPIFFR